MVLKGRRSDRKGKKGKENDRESEEEGKGNGFSFHFFFLAVRVGRKSIGSINNGDKDVGFFGLVGVNGTWR